MKKFTALAFVLALTAPPVFAAAPTTAPPRETPAEEDRVEASRAALSSIDTERLLTDRDYAAEVLGHIDILSPESDDPNFQGALDNLRLYALMTLERGEDSRAVLDRVILRRPDAADQYVAPWWAALSILDYGRAVTLIDLASRNVLARGWADLREMLGREAPAILLHHFKTERDDASRVRLAEALYRVGWPGDGDREAADFLRSILLDQRLAQGDRQGARDYAAGIMTPSGVLPLLALRRYDEVLPSDADRLAMLRAAIAEHDGETADAIAGAAPSMRRILDRASFLRSVGRDSEALDVLAPHLEDVPATVAASEEGMWAVNEAVYTLISLGRFAEATALMERLIAIPLSENGSLIGPYINHIAVLSRAGHHADALAFAQELEADSDRYANDYGKMWILSSSICALSGLGRGGEASPLIERMRALGDANPAAMTRAFVCLDDMASAETELVERLQGDDPETAVLALQDYTLVSETAPPDPLFERFIALRDRPAVRGALDRVGRVMQLPLARTYWGGT